MRNETKESNTQDQSTRTNKPVRMIKENMAEVSSTKSLKNATLGDSKNEAKKPIYLDRYE